MTSPIKVRRRGVLVAEPRKASRGGDSNRSCRARCNALDPAHHCNFGQAILTESEEKSGSCVLSRSLAFKTISNYL
jgi:hypothetical protein